MGLLNTTQRDQSVSREQKAKEARCLCLCPVSHSLLRPEALLSEVLPESQKAFNSLSAWQLGR
jgi:hypothetical protein